MKLSDILNFSLGSLTVGKILLALLVAGVCYFVSKGLIKGFDNIVSKSKVDKSLQGFIKGTTHIVIYFVIIVIVADCLDISIVSFVAVFSIAGLAISMAAESSLANLVGGVILLLLKPFKVGDYVEAGSNSGTVREIGLIYTQIVTLDNKVVYLPNGDVSSNHIINYSKEDTRRVELKVTASYDAPTKCVKEALFDAIGKVPKIASDPAPLVKISAYNDSSIEYTVRVWTENSHYLDVYFDLMEQVRTSFDEKGVEMTYKHLNVHVLEDSGKNKAK